MYLQAYFCSEAVTGGFLKYFFAIFTGKRLWWSIFLTKLQCNFIKKRLQHKRFNEDIAKFLRTPILKNICEWLLLSVANIYTDFLHEVKKQPPEVFYEKRCS